MMLVDMTSDQTTEVRVCIDRHKQNWCKVSSTIGASACLQLFSLSCCILKILINWLAIICMLHRFTQAASVKVSSSWLSNNTNEGNIGTTKSRRQTAMRGIWRRHWRMQSNDKYYKSLLKIICHSFHVGFTSLLVILPIGNFSAEMEVKQVFSCT